MRIHNLQDIIAFSLFVGEVEASGFTDSCIESWNEMIVEDHDHTSGSTCMKCVVEAWYKTASEIIDRLQLIKITTVNKTNAVMMDFSD